MWDRIASSDIEQAKHGLNQRRAETLNRHAEEIKVLDADQSEVDQLAAAIATFISKFGKDVGSLGASTGEMPEEKSADDEDPEVDQKPAPTFGLNFRRFE